MAMLGSTIGLPPSTGPASMMFLNCAFAMPSVKAKTITSILFSITLKKQPIGQN